MEKQELSKKIGLLVMQSRTEKGISRYGLARLSGVTPPHVTFIERGTGAIRIDILNKICKALELEIVFPIE